MTDVAQSKPDATTNHLSLQPSISESEETRERERETERPRKGNGIIKRAIKMQHTKEEKKKRALL